MMKTLLAGIFALLAAQAEAHPHIFVDGRVDFVFGETRRLEAIEVTWVYDPFETLYILSALQIDPGPDWSLSETERETLIAYESDWAEGFNGAARLSHAGASVDLAPPEAYRVRLSDNRLEVRFTRRLTSPAAVTAESIDVTFYEGTYYYAFTIAEAPRLLNAPDHCMAALAPFDPDAQSEAIQAALLKLGREETPEDAEIGALFTDRIALSCA